MMFLACPAYLDRDGTARFGLPAEVRYRFTMRSSGGLLESAMIRCPAGHWFNGPIEPLTWESTDNHNPGRTGRRPNTAPAFYLGRPAGLWITIMRPRRGRTAPTRCKPSPVPGRERHVRAAAYSPAPGPDLPA
jgi:hypothetical protein